MGTFSHFVNTICQHGYILGWVAVVFLGLFFISIYSFREEKKKLRRSNDRQKVFQKAFETTKDAVLILSDDYKVEYANQTMVSLLGLKKNFQFRTLKNMPQIYVEKKWIGIDAYLDSNKDSIGQRLLSLPQTIWRVSGAKERQVNICVDALSKEGQGDKKHYILTLQDVSEIKKISGLAYRHTLTGMPNQMKAMQDIPALFSKIHSQNSKIALALLQFDNFSKLRFIIGYEQSVDVIKNFSNYLQTIVSDMNVQAYHTFDNHFLLTFSNVGSAEEAKALIREIQAKLSTLYKMEDASLHLTVSVGIAVYPESGSTRKLLDNTYKALDMAQREGHGRIVVYTPDEVPAEFDDIRLYNDMKIGLEKGEFEVYYQPIVNAKSEEVVAAEALIRWNHPGHGFIPPDVFIGLMEKTGFIVNLGQYILEEVLRQQKRWELFKFKPIEVSINVSMVEMATGKFVEHVSSRLKHHQVDPCRIKFEITEGVAMLNEEKTEHYFEELKELGVGLSLDDFGTGYTSFTYLKKFPADIVKIDKSLIDDILTSDEDRRIVYAMIELGHNMGMKVVVEGVETKEMAELLVSFGCDYIQGYYYSKPLPLFDFQNLLRPRSQNRDS